MTDELTSDEFLDQSPQPNIPSTFEKNMKNIDKNL